MGTVILGKLESGSISKAQQLVMMPNRVSCPTIHFFISWNQEVLTFREKHWPFCHCYLFHYNDTLFSCSMWWRC